MSAGIVVDASAIVDLVTASPRAERVWQRLRDADLHAPAHVDAEVLSALGRLLRANEIAEAKAEDALARTVSMPVTRHELPDLLRGAWIRRGTLRATDSLYVELAERLGMVVVTTDRRLARVCPIAQEC
ncbi:MAG TPA: type II toxin-antitoxin system VapC family toxin [Aldersonia sp.]